MGSNRHKGKAKQVAEVAEELIQVVEGEKNAPLSRLE
jgi:hypothetical protein